MGAINSHIQITKSLLRNFSHRTNEGEKVYYLDLLDNQIKEEKVKKLGTELGYYSEEVEKYLNEKVENKIGDVAKRFRDFSKQKINELIVTEEDQESIKQFFKYSMIRSGAVIKAANKASYISSFFGGYTTNDIISFVDDSLLVSPFMEYYADILINESDIEFVIPRNCFYSAMIKDKPTKYILPINPRVAFILIHNSEFDRYIVDGKYHYHQINDDDVAISCNRRALFDEKQYNNKFIVANRKKELEDLQEYINR